MNDDMIDDIVYALRQNEGLVVPSLRQFRFDFIKRHPDTTLYNDDANEPDETELEVYEHELTAYVKDDIYRYGRLEGDGFIIDVVELSIYYN